MPRGPKPTITREEYFRLLDTAKQLRREQAYFLAKVFATTGISVSELSKLTVETVGEGKLNTSDGDVIIPPGLRDELISYARRKAIGAGPVFVTRNRQPVSMTRVSIILHGLGTAAGLGEGKSRSSALRELYQTAKEEAETMAAAMVEQVMNKQADREPEQLKAYMEE